jgi:outer membrane biogenesis lipoprotein LolB
MRSERVRRARLGSVACAALVAAGCAQRPLQVPTGTGTPLPDFAAIHASLAQPCAGVRTFTAELALSGRAGGQKLRGRALAGFEAPSSMRLEGLAPFGPPAFILVSRGDAATLLLPRDDRVLRNAAPEDILGALTGVTLAPADVQAVLTGCVVPAPKALGGAQLGEDWRRLDLDGGARVFLRRTGGRWQLRAAERSGWRVEYAEWQGAFPKTVRLVSERVDVTAAVSQFESNRPIDAAAFAVDVPPEAVPITLDELRDAGPLRGSSAGTR